MAIASGRRIEHVSRAYEWVVRRRGNDFRLVVQDAAARGQFLIAWFSVYSLCEMNEARGDYFMRQRISPALIRFYLAKAQRGGWRPLHKGLPPFRLGSPGGQGYFVRGSGSLDCIDGLWRILDAMCRDPAWRERLASNTSELLSVPVEYVRGLGLAECVTEAGDLVVYVRARNDHGDPEPYLAIRSLAWEADVVLEDASSWHMGWTNRKA